MATLVRLCVWRLVSRASCHLPASRSRPMPEWISSDLASSRSWLVGVTGDGNDWTTLASSVSDLAASTSVIELSSRPVSITPAAYSP